jgi:hypothetical protein
MRKLIGLWAGILLFLMMSLPANATPQNTEITHWLNGCKFHYQFGTYLTVPYVWGETQGGGYKCNVYALRLAYARGSQTTYKDRIIKPDIKDEGSRISYKYQLSGPAGWNAYGARVCFGATDHEGETELQFNVHLSIYAATDVEVSSRYDFCKSGF